MAVRAGALAAARASRAPSGRDLLRRGHVGRLGQPEVRAQERQLELDGLFVAVEEGLVVPAGPADELAPWSAFGRVDSGTGKRRLIIVVDHDQQRTLHPACLATGLIEADRERRTSRDCLLPVRIPVPGIER